MNPSIGAISKWKYLLLLKLWWTGMQFAIFTTFLDIKENYKIILFYKSRIWKKTFKFGLDFSNLIIPLS